jgi:putative two-component system response regulator
MKVLIADDDPISIELLQAALVEYGYEVEVARDGREALEMLESGESRLVVSDWEMPGLRGPELCREVRSRSFPGYVYIILLTARNSKNDVVEGLSAGADDFICKPFEPAELRVRLRAGERILSLETRDVAIFAMAKLAESRDPETGSHLERIRNYTRVIARQLLEHGKFSNEVNPDYVGMIYLTSPLHDIGKVGIPDSVLLKPGRLSDEEFQIMKTHTLIGAGTLSATLQYYPGVAYLRMARDVALTHHERFDGRGYPHGLAGQDVPLCGRIVALADVYDAITSKRVYKQSFTHSVARNIVIDQAGSHFDPAIVEAFLDCESEVRAICEQFRDDQVSPSRNLCTVKCETLEKCGAPR